jgi:hypothetical protein
MFKWDFHQRPNVFMYRPVRYDLPEYALSSAFMEFVNCTRTPKVINGIVLLFIALQPRCLLP